MGSKAAMMGAAPPNDASRPSRAPAEPPLAHLCAAASAPKGG
jgi:hypothetical protein